MVFIASIDSPEILKPCKETFNFPTATIPLKFSTILGFLFYPVLFMRRNQFNPTFIKKLLVKTITVICFIPNKALRCIFSKTGINGFLNQGYFVGRSAFHVSGDRKTRSVCNCHDLGPLATFCFANCKTPFFAGTNDPSIKASRISIPPRSYRSCASSWAMSRNTPCLTHCWNRLWHVWVWGIPGWKILPGRSCSQYP